MTIPRAVVTTRRRLLGSAAAAAGVVLAGPLLAACSSGAKSGGPTVAVNGTVVVWNPFCSYWALPAKTTLSLVEHALQPFLQKNPSIRLKSAGPMVNTTDTTNAILAGSAPDVFPDNNISPYIEGNLLLDLTKFMRQDNVDSSLFATSQMAKFTTAGGVYALPAYVGTTVMLVNQQIVSEAGLSNPEAGWTYQEWTTLFKGTASRKGNVVRYGTSLFGGAAAPFLLHGFGASVVDPSDPTKCGLDTPGAVECINWAAGLLNEQVAFSNGGGQAHTQQLFKAGQATAPVLWIQMLPHWVPLLQGMSWDFYQMPLWPVQPATFCNSDFWAISGNTKVPDAAWTLLKEICVGTTYSELLMQAALFPPSLKSLWPNWVEVVKSVAPPLHNKNLDVFSEYVLTDHAYPGLDFKYQNATVQSLIGGVVGQIQSGQVSAQLGLQQVAQRVNAIETAAGAMTARSGAGLIDQFPQAPSASG